jgi:hypothetical protein
MPGARHQRGSGELSLGPVEANLVERFIHLMGQSWFARWLLVDWISGPVARGIGGSVSPAISIFIIRALKVLGTMSREGATVEIKWILEQARAIKQLKDAAGLGEIAAEADGIEAEESAVGL